MDPQLGQRLVRQRARLVNSKLGHLEMPSQRLDTGHAWADPGARSGRDGGGQHVGRSEGDGHSRQHHRRAAMRIPDHGDDRAAEPLLACLQREHGVVVVLAIRHQGTRAGQRAEFQFPLGELRVDDLVSAVVQPPRHGFVLFDDQLGQAPAVELAHQ